MSFKTYDVFGTMALDRQLVMY
uniref:Uncharacterized protein n=1 Tax=Arundo donax TaxID=35708 RepID=A0A0A9B8K7_ARUDO